MQTFLEYGSLLHVSQPQCEILAFYSLVIPKGEDLNPNRVTDSLTAGILIRLRSTLLRHVARSKPDIQCVSKLHLTGKVSDIFRQTRAARFIIT